MICRVTEGLQEKADSGEIGYFGINEATSELYVAPTHLITDPEKLDEFSEGLLHDLRPTYRWKLVNRIYEKETT